MEMNDIVFGFLPEQPIVTKENEGESQEEI